MTQCRLALAVSGLMLTLGCAGGVTPTTTPDPSTQATLPGAFDVAQGNGLENGTALAAWDLTLADGAATLEPVRSSQAIGDNFTVNGKFFFTVSPDPAALVINGFKFDPSGDLQVEWGIRHPFKSVAQGATRADLDVFDLSLAFQPMGESGMAIPGADRSVFADVLRRSDGYTPILDAVAGTNDLLPFVVLETANPFNRFPQGTDYTPLETTFDLDPGEEISLRVYLTCQYGVSATRPTRLTPRYFNPEYNMKSAWQVDLTETANTLIDGQAGNLDLQVAVYDWQQGLSADPSYPDDANPTGLRAISDVAAVTCFVPALSATPIELTSATGGTGAIGDPLLYDFTIPSAAAPTEGSYWLMVKVRDSRLPNDNVAPASSGIDVANDGAISFYNPTEYSTYQIMQFAVAPGVPVNLPPVAAVTTTPNPPVILAGASVSFDASTSNDPDGSITTYEWDFDYQAGTPVWVTGSATTTPQTFPTVGTFTVAVQVTDNGTPGLTDIETVDVTVNPLPPSVNKAVWATFSAGSISRGNPDGTGAVVIGNGRYPRISADGSTVVFSAGAGIGGSLYTWRQASGVTLLRAQADDPLTYGFRADEVDLTADGSRVVYTDARAGANPAKDCWAQDWNGANLVKISLGDGGCYENPKIAANGSIVALYKRSAGRVMKVNPDGTGLLDIGPSSDGAPFVNATGTMVYVERSFRNLWRTDINGNNATFLRYVGDYWAVAANESKVVYMDIYDNGRDVWVANLDGTGTPVKVMDADVDGYSGWFCSVSSDGLWVGWGGLLSQGGTYNTTTGIRYMTPAVFGAQLYDGVSVGPVGEF